MSRGYKSSEFIACMIAFLGVFLLSAYGLYNGSDLSELAILNGSVVVPCGWYAHKRTNLKQSKGE